VHSLNSAGAKNGLQTDRLIWSLRYHDGDGNSARATCFLVLFFTVTARLRSWD